ncbi:prolyl 3-hydroxylase 1 isoform X1 [Paramormyrops kingsleyae]|uniref:prolyl 3-hydroxylase 1 isoform X1 n=1 Tax=Paramormyrops kingsleyae TaxID=1676925 RepID=UPI003B96BBF5
MYGYVRNLLCALSFIHHFLMDTSLNINVTLEPYDLLFDNAVEAYYKGDWMSVILNMERALLNKGAIRRVRAQCRLSCANLNAFGGPVPGLGFPVPGNGSVEDLSFFQKILKRADCVSSCEAENLGPPSKHKISEEVELEFQKRTPYNYLQVAYFKINKLDKAVAAAYTFSLANPEHMEMRQNLEYYRMMAGIQEIHFKDLEAKPHMSEFLQGKKFYSLDEFSLAIEHFETAVEEYFAADLECRALCEGIYDYDGYNYLEYSADLFQSMTDHYMQILNCKQNCAIELAILPGTEKPLEDFLPGHFNYLQFSYFNRENYEKAIECAKTYLLFHPEEEVMNQNVAYYSAVLGEEQAMGISAREVIQKHITQSLLEKELLYFGYEVFGIAFVDPDSWTPPDIMPQKLRDKQKTERETAARITEEIGHLMKEIETLVEEKAKESTDIAQIVREGGSVLFDDIVVAMTSRSLNGSQRVVLDGVITDDECWELHRLSNTAALKGDGYRGKPSPHSPSEMFQGVTVLKAAKMGQEGKVPLKSAQLYFNLSEKVRKVVESYFRLETPLYFSYTHLVCRSAFDDKQEGREDLSHPIHVDNCQLISELNDCVKEPPAYTHRDYSAILYLNDDFEGGDFIFTELDAKTITATVRPRCGRVVGFGAGKENPHGVTAVTKGQRCAVALWFTLDPRHNEKERIHAEDLLKMLSSPVDADFLEAKKNSNEPMASDPETMAGVKCQVQSDEIVDQQTGIQVDEKGMTKDAEKPANVQGQEEQKKVRKTKVKEAEKDKQAVKQMDTLVIANMDKPSVDRMDEHTINKSNFSRNESQQREQTPIKEAFTDKISEDSGTQPSVIDTNQSGLENKDTQAHKSDSEEKDEL